jgi:hypothetical protein
MATMNTIDKSEFQVLVSNINAMLENIDFVYLPMIEIAQAFDAELAKKIEATMKADLELLEYVRNKTEAQ